MEEQKKPDIGKLKLQYWMWVIGMKGLLGIACVFIVSEGIRLLVPQLSPRITFLDRWEETRGLDLAFIPAAFFVITTWVCVHLILKQFREKKEEEATDKEKRDAAITYVAGWIVIFCDCALFYTAITQMRWGDSFFSTQSFLTTLGYLAVLFTVSYVAIRLKEEIEKAEKVAAEIEQAEAEIRQPQSAVRVM